MKKEERWVSFNNNDVTVALRDCGANLGLEIPEGELTQIQNSANEENGFIFEFTTEANTTATVEAKTHIVLACLVRFCHKEAIPMPLKSQKTVYLQGESICMKIIVEEGMPECAV